MTAILRNHLSEPIFSWTAVRRRRLDGSFVHDDPSWAFVDVEGDTLHLRRMALSGTGPEIPGVLPPDLFFVEPGEEQVTSIALPVPVPEQNPLRRRAIDELWAAEARAPVLVQRVVLTLGYLTHAVASPYLRPLGTAHPGVFKMWPGKDLTPAQRLLSASTELPEPLEALRYAPAD